MTQCDRPCPQTLHYNHIGLLSTVFLWGTVTAKTGWSLVKDIKRAPPGTNISREKRRRRRRRRRGRGRREEPNDEGALKLQSVTFSTFKDDSVYSGIYEAFQHAVGNGKCNQVLWMWTIFFAERTNLESTGIDTCKLATATVSRILTHISTCARPALLGLTGTLDEHSWDLRLHHKATSFKVWL